VTAELALAIVGALVLAYAGFVFALVVLGRRDDARALARFVPDCVVFFRRLLADGRVRRRDKLLLAALVPYLLLPFDLVPDFIPVAGQLDDAVLIALVLRRVVRAAGREVVEEHWPGPRASLTLVLRLAG
jgi:uncharacterized membrane protein YkvA (DUF1232 family)